MSLKEIETAITQLPANAVGELTAWLVEYHHQLWDKQMEEDLEAGRLDKMLADVDKECQAGLPNPSRTLLT